MIQRMFAGLAAILFSATAFAVTVAERSPFAQGHWWNPARSGEGFDIFNAGGQVAVMWFTYDTAGKPVWYTAQGEQSSIGSSWPLLKHRWADGHKAGFTQVGTLRLDVNHPESMRVSWAIGAASGTSTIEPFRASGVTGEIDHTGSWFDPSNSGWGIAVVQQGEVLGGAVFTYDAAGEPTWVAGFERNDSSVEYFSSRGACPSCAYASPAYTSAGRLRFEFNGEREATVRNSLTLAMAAGVNADGAKLVQLGRPASSRAADRQLASYEDDAALRSYLAAGMFNVPHGFGGADFSASPPASSVSTTNLVEQGVDEPDLIKSDGRYVYSFAGGNGIQPAPRIRVARVGDEASALDMVASINLASGASTPMTMAGLMLQGSTLVSITGTQPYSGFISPWSSSGAWLRGTTTVEVMDVTRPEQPTLKWRAQIDGHVLSARRIGDRLYVITRFVPDVPGFSYGATSGPAFENNRQIIANTSTTALLPAVRINGGGASPLVSASHVYAPPQGARPPMADMVVVSAINLVDLRIAQVVAILGAADASYVSPNNLYLATSRYALRSANGTLLPEPPLYLTDVSQVRLAPDALEVVGTGSVEGYLATNAERAQFRMSEFQGKLRVVTSSAGMWGADNYNKLTILEPSTVTPGLLRTVSYLPNAKRPEPLGKPGEQLYGTRFMNERLYAVTFKMIDPLYIVDLVDVSDPRVTGSVQMPGFAEYLHPLPNGMLLGFGKDAVPAVDFGDGSFAWYQGLLLSLYDVSNAGAPREVQRVVLGMRGSDSALLRDHHAFSSIVGNNGSGVVAFPASLNEGSPPFVPSPSYYYPWKQSGLMRYALQGSSAADMRLVALQPLITHSAGSSTPYFTDGARYNARSVLFGAGSVYLSNGQLWRQDRNGQSFGPY
jgi:uncharacterized secreted protein with C-terminal beta-propeller domain